MAEAHPVGFQWVVARASAARRVIHVDPRFSRTSAMADFWVPLRAGSDIVFLGGLINYVLERGPRLPRLRRRVHERVRPSSATTSKGPTSSTGCSPAGTARQSAQLRHERTLGSLAAATSAADRRDRPRACIRRSALRFQLLKRHFARYTPEMVERACGVPRDAFLEVARVFTRGVGPGAHRDDLLRGRPDAALDRRADHPRRGDPAAAARQRRPARRRRARAARPRVDSGIDRHPDALRHASRAICRCRSSSRAAAGRCAEYLLTHRPPTGVWAATDAFLVSLLKAWYGEAATRANDFGFDWLPRLTGDHSHFALLARHGGRRSSRACS